MNITTVKVFFMHYLASYFTNRSYKDTLKHFAPDITGFGTGVDETSLESKNLPEIFEREFKEAKKRIIYYNDHFEYIRIEDACWVVYGTLNIRTSINNIPFKLENLRMSVLIRENIGQPEIIHLHVSLPNIDQKLSESFPVTAIIKRNLILENTIEKQTKKLKKNINELSQTNAQKDKLFTIIAHDLKGPIGSTTALTDVMLKKLHNAPSYELKNLLLSINNSSRNTFSLLSNILDWASTQIGAIQFQPSLYNLNELIIEVKSALEWILSSKKINFQIQYDNNSLVKGDKFMLITILRNIIWNAIKYSKVGEEIIIEFKEMKKYSYITIKDQGIGIPSVKLKNLLMLSSDYKKPGTCGETGSGLGLLICKELINIHGGKLIIHSKVSIGTTVTIKLPRS